MISQKVLSSILEQIDFPNPEVLGAVESVVVSAANFARAGFDFDAAYPDDSGNAVSESILTLSRNYAKLPSPQNREEVVGAFSQLFDPADDAQEAAGESLFAASIDFVVNASTLNEVMKSLAPADNDGE